MTPEEREAAVRNLSRGAWALGVAGVAAIVFGVLAKQTSLGSAKALAKVDSSTMILGGALALAMAGSIIAILWAVNGRGRS
jgi:hypothetical protein